MSEEEKQAVEKMQYVLDLINKNGEYTADVKDIKHIIVITNLIINQQREIEELIEINNKYNDMKYFAMAADRYISKDKIRKFMKDYQEGDMVEITGVCKFLLGE